MTYSRSPTTGGGRRFSTEQLLVIASSEINRLLPEDCDGHVLAYGSTSARWSSPSPGRITRRRPGSALTAGHVPRAPGLTGATKLDLPDGVSGIEIANAGCELEVARGVSTVHWDDAETGRLCFGIAADDCTTRASTATTHGTGRGPGSGRNRPCSRRWRWAASTALPPARSSTRSRWRTAVEVALRAGRSRCAPGGERIGGERRSARLSLRRPDACSGDGGGITHARLERPARNPYGRVEVVDLQAGGPGRTRCGCSDPRPGGDRAGERRFDCS
jgi:hypothetical protein